MTRVVKAYRREMQKSLQKDDWRDIMRKPVVSDVDAMTEAIEDCRYAVKLDGGKGSFAALYNHFSMWLYGEVTECDYYVAIKEIRSRLFCSNCLVTRDSQGRKLPDMKTPFDIKGVQ